jgi:hypothetical protein
MNCEIELAEYVGDYTIRLRFEDGLEGDVDLKDELWGEVFKPLSDLSFFRQVRLDREIGTIVWPNGADFAPEFLYEKVRVA